jgi:hypothetical protein
MSAGRLLAESQKKLSRQRFRNIFSFFLLSYIAITAGAAEPAAPCPHKAGTAPGSGQRAR